MTGYGGVVVMRNEYRMLPHGDSNGFDGSWEVHRTVPMGERGVVVRLGRNDRLDIGGRTFDGLDYRAVEIRRWHDGSLTVEREYDR